MFRITKDPSSGSDNLYLTEITHNCSNVLIMCVVGVWRRMPPNTDHAHDKYLWNIKSNFSQSTGYHRIFCDPKYVGV